VGGEREETERRERRERRDRRERREKAERKNGGFSNHQSPITITHHPPPITHHPSPCPRNDHGPAVAEPRDRGADVAAAGGGRENRVIG
jgi:hypothetical protein